MAKPKRKSKKLAARSTAKLSAVSGLTGAAAKTKAASVSSKRAKSKSNKPRPKKPVAVRQSVAAPAEAAIKPAIKAVRRQAPQRARIFAILSVVILTASVLFWTILTARLHQLNADQLIDAYLFENWHTFQGAIFPGAHSFLLKWPLFWAMSLLGNTPAVYMAATILTVALTLGVLVYIMYKIENRPVVFGLLCLALASMLLLVPAQPVPGTLLPVNMAMTTTRNLEYAVYIIALYLALRSRSMRSYSFGVSMILMIVLIASDKLFAVLGIGSALIACVWYAVRYRRRAMMSAESRWLLLCVVSAAAATGLLLAVNSLSITNIGNGETASPYPVVQSAAQAGTALIYGAGALATNFGANAIHSTTVIREIPAALLDSLVHIASLGYLVNLLLLIAGLYACLRLFVGRSTSNTKPFEAATNNSDAAPSAPSTRMDIWSRLAVLLVGSTVAAAAVYVLTDHYYPVDARYMTIGLFTVYAAAAVYLRSRRIAARYAAALGAMLVVVIAIGFHTSWTEYRADAAALAGKQTVTNRVSEELRRNNIARLVGDYWDVTPIKAKTTTPLTIMPVEQCTMPREVLTSKYWFQKPDRTSAAYLAVKDAAAPSARQQTRDSATYNGCSLARIVGTYGVPGERVAIDRPAGQASGDTPDILLLLYPNGIRLPQFQADKQPLPRIDNLKAAAAAPIRPRQFAPLGSTNSNSDKNICQRGTSLQFVAHQDDDLLFMNPDVYNSIKDGRCIRTVYMTAGDAGEDSKYWSERENGAKAAYAEMYNTPNKWRDEQQILAGQTVAVSFLIGQPSVSLVFLRLPDGNMRGEGFAGNSFESMQTLLDGTAPLLHTVDDVSSYNEDQLVAALREIMTRDQPDQIRTQGSDDRADGDHTDHYDTGVLAMRAAESYQQPHEMMRYLGYPDKTLPINLSDDDITSKQSIFLAYAKHDGAVCQSAFECQNTYTYGNYLMRQYQLGSNAPQ